MMLGSPKHKPNVLLIAQSKHWDCFLGIAKEMAGAALRRAGQAMAPLLAGRSASVFEATRVLASHPLLSSSSTQDCISFIPTKFLQDALSEFKLSPCSSQHLNLQGSAQMERLSEEEAIAMLTPMGAPSSSFLEEGMLFSYSLRFKIEVRFWKIRGLKVIFHIFSTKLCARCIALTKRFPAS